MIVSVCPVRLLHRQRISCEPSRLLYQGLYLEMAVHRHARDSFDIRESQTQSQTQRQGAPCTWRALPLVCLSCPVCSRLVKLKPITFKKDKDQSTCTTRNRGCTKSKEFDGLDVCV